MEPFETERLLLRPLISSDLDDLYRLYANPVLMQYITGLPRTFEETRQRLAKYQADCERFGFSLCAAIFKPTGRMIGRCGIEPVQTALGLEGDLAWMFDPPYWGQGLATEFAVAMLAFAWANLPIQRAFATADPRNAASVRVMQKIGMKFLKGDEVEVEYEAWPDRAVARI